MALGQQFLYEVFSAVLLGRLRVYAEGLIEEYHCAFRQGRSTIDQVFAMRQVMKKYYEYDTDLHMLFVDFFQAFNSIRRDRITKFLQEYGIPQKIINLIRLTLVGTTAQVKISDRISRSFVVATGVRQGTLSWLGCSL